MERGWEMTITLHWWMLPLVIFVIGVLWGLKVGNTPEGGYFPMNGVIGAAIMFIMAVISIAICVGRWLA